MDCKQLQGENLFQYHFLEKKINIKAFLLIHINKYYKDIFNIISDMNQMNFLIV